MMTKTPPLIEFLETNFGQLEGVMRLKKSAFQVIRFKDQPDEGAQTFCTLGLSKHAFPQAENDPVRHELLFACYDDAPEEAATIVAMIGEDLVREHRALEQGEIIGPAGPLVPESTCEALFALLPVLWPDEAHVFTGSDPVTVLVWLVPITHAEAHYAVEHGWEALESRFGEEQPDLLDLFRQSVV